ncbi:hypothetical protein D3C76_1438200 [compost metagenome]
MLDTILFENGFHGGISNLVDGIHHAVVNQADAFKARVARSFHPILERVRADFGGAHRIDVTCNSPIRSKQFNILSLHFSVLIRIGINVRTD